MSNIAQRKQELLDQLHQVDTRYDRLHKNDAWLPWLCVAFIVLVAVISQSVGWTIAAFFSTFVFTSDEREIRGLLRKSAELRTRLDELDKAVQS